MEISVRTIEAPRAGIFARLPTQALEALEVTLVTLAWRGLLAPGIRIRRELDARAIEEEEEARS